VYHTPPAAARSIEWYTPPEILARVRAVLERIHLDPASCPRAQRVVQAQVYYRKGDGALRRRWSGQTWLNPPFELPALAQFVRKLIAEHEARRVPAAVVLVPGDRTNQPWCQELIAAAAICWPKRRIAFWNRHPSLLVTGNPRPSLIGYLGPHVEWFVDVFADLGVITPAGDVMHGARLALRRELAA